MQNPVEKLQFSNGLQVMLQEIHTAPIVTNWIWYRVGSRDEVPGITGISHWVEHMQFKGTPKFPAGILDIAVSRDGGVWNAFTYMDWTTYYETMPAGKIELGFQLEADRMVNSNFDPEEVTSERSVIISERQGSENQPLFRLGEEVQAAAFRIHPYHHEVIGDMADLQSINREQLYDHYRKFYIPNNAVLVVAGDFETNELAAHLQDLFEPLASGKEIARVSRPEPKQMGERNLVVEGPGETSYLQVSYHSPPASDVDFFPLIVLDSLLTGPSSLNMFGGGISNKTSRLYRSLVEGEFAVSVQGSLPATIDPFLYTITITIHPDRRPDEVLSLLDDEIKRIQDEMINFDILDRAVKQARALFAYGCETITNQAFWMGFSEMFSTYGWYTGYLDKLGAVTPADVKRVAQKYLLPQNRIVGRYLPADNNDEVRT
jgi:zinc protease